MPALKFEFTDDFQDEGFNLLQNLVKEVHSQEGSDLIVKDNRVAYMWVRGEAREGANTPISRRQVELMIVALVNLREGSSKAGDIDSLLKLLNQNMSACFVAAVCCGDDDDRAAVRVRVRVFRDIDGLSFHARILPATIRSFGELGFDEDICRRLKIQLTSSHGLILINGPSSSGKTTTLAAMINYINLTRSVRIITAEDPLETIYPKHQSQITPWEVRGSFPPFPTSRSLIDEIARQNPDVLAMGEVRTIESMEAALSASDNRLVFAFVHAHGNRASDGIDRVIQEFPKPRRPFVCPQLANNLRCIISQRLLPTPNKQDQVLGYEYLENSHKIQAAIANNRASRISSLLESPSVPWDQRLTSLFEKESISFSTYVKHLD